LVISSSLQLVNSFGSSIDRKEVLLEELFKLGPHGNGEGAGGELLSENALRPFRASEK